MTKMTKEQAIELLKNRKVHVKDAQESKEVQSKLLRIGFIWADGVSFIQHTDLPYLFIWEDMEITQASNAYPFFLNKKAEISAEEIKAIEIVETEQPDSPMKITLQDYPELALETATYPREGLSIIYPTIGLSGEAGEVAEKVKKVLRDKDGRFGDTDCLEIVKELGDVLWYVNALARDLGYTLEQVAQENIRKIHSRRDRGMIHGNGDNR